MRREQIQQWLMWGVGLLVVFFIMGRIAGPARVPVVETGAAATSQEIAAAPTADEPCVATADPYDPPGNPCPELATRIHEVSIPAPTATPQSTYTVTFEIRSKGKGTVEIYFSVSKVTIHKISHATADPFWRYSIPNLDGEHTVRLAAMADGGQIADVQCRMYVNRRDAKHIRAARPSPPAGLQVEQSAECSGTVP